MRIRQEDRLHSTEMVVDAEDESKERDDVSGKREKVGDFFN